MPVFELARAQLIRFSSVKRFLMTEIFRQFFNFEICQKNFRRLRDFPGGAGGRSRVLRRGARLPPPLYFRVCFLTMRNPVPITYSGRVIRAPTNGFVFFSRVSSRPRGKEATAVVVVVVVVAYPHICMYTFETFSPRVRLFYPYGRAHAAL